MGQRIAIVGCGYVGCALGRRLVELGHDVIGTTTTPAREDALRSHDVRPVVVELTNEQRLRETLNNRDVVFVMVAPGKRQSYQQVYFDGVGRLLEALADSSVQRVVYTSSTSVYGQTDGSWVNEESPTTPRTDSGRTLVETEQRLLAGAAALGIGVTILRLAGICGPDRGPINVVPRYAGCERRDGEGWVNLIHRDAIVDACVKLLDVPYDGVINLSDGAPIRRRDLYDRLVAAAGLAPIDWLPAEPPLDYGKRVSNRRAESLLGLRLPRDGIA